MVQLALLEPKLLKKTIGLPKKKAQLEEEGEKRKRILDLGLLENKEGLKKISLRMKSESLKSKRSRNYEAWPLCFSHIVDTYRYIIWLKANLRFNNLGKIQLAFMLSQHKDKGMFELDS